MSALPDPARFAAAAPLVYGPRARARDDGALVREHLPLVRRLAWHVHGSVSTAVEVEDLVQVGLVALVEAGRAFQVRDGGAGDGHAGEGGDRGAATFRQYLVTRLRGAMIDELRRHAAMTRGAIRRRREYQGALAALSGELGHAPSEAQLAERLGVSRDKLRTDYAGAEALRVESIDEVYADDQPWFASDEPDAFEQLAEGQLRTALIAAIAALPEREAMVIQLYHVEELNLEEIGQVLGVGAARVCQIKAAAHARLKKAIKRG